MKIKISPAAIFFVTLSLGATMALPVFWPFFCGHAPLLVPALQVAPSFLKMSQTISPTAQKCSACSGKLNSTTGMSDGPKLRAKASPAAAATCVGSGAGGRLSGPGNGRRRQTPGRHHDRSPGFGKTGRGNHVAAARAHGAAAPGVPLTDTVNTPIW